MDAFEETYAHVTTISEIVGTGSNQGPPISSK